MTDLARSALSCLTRAVAALGANLKHNPVGSFPFAEPTRQPESTTATTPSTEEGQ